jgi:hypothetical protein
LIQPLKANLLDKLNEFSQALAEKFEYVNTKGSGNGKKFSKQRLWQGNGRYWSIQNTPRGVPLVAQQAAYGEYAAIAGSNTVQHNFPARDIWLYYAHAARKGHNKLITGVAILKKQMAGWKVVGNGRLHNLVL